MEQQIIYLDHAATTPLSEAALEAMLPCFRTSFGNPSAIYSYGQEAKNLTEKCRDRVAKAIGAMRSEIYFTSGGTESDNWAIRSACKLKKPKGRHIISTLIEHNAVRNTLEDLAEEGWEITWLKPDHTGQITPAQLEKAIRPDTVLISIMLANNVVGTLLPIRDLAAVARKHHVLFHTDAVQAVGHIPLNVRNLGVDFLSISAHKFGGPKGVGALFCKVPLRLPPILTGGGQEKGGRSGTENVPGIVGMTVALEDSILNMQKNTAHINLLTERLNEGIRSMEGILPTGDPELRLPGFCSYVVEGIPHSVYLVNALNEHGICISSGSACSASSREASHVLAALGYSSTEAGCSLRITIGSENNAKEIDQTISTLQSALKALRNDSVPGVIG